MRCKNCGSDNDDNRYICANCGSPLYDEDDFGKTNVMPKQGIPSNQVKPAKNQLEDYPYDDNNYDNDNDNKDNNDKKSIIVIAILVVVLIAIVASVIAVANAKKHNNDNLTTTNHTTVVAESSTTKEYTTAKETTTETTTQAETTGASYSVSLYSKGGGTVICTKTSKTSANYDRGDNVTIIATPNPDYQFDGWYSDGTLLSTASTYSFTITSNMNISAQFSLIPVTTTAEPEPTTAENIEVYE